MLRKNGNAELKIYLNQRKYKNIQSVRFIILKAETSEKSTTLDK